MTLNIDNFENLKKMAFSLTKIKEQNCFTGWKMNLSNFNKYMIIYVTKGSGDLHINNRQFPIETNTCFLLVPGMNISIETNPYDPLQFYELSFVFKLLCNDQNEKNGFPLQGEIPIPNSLEVLKIIKELYEIKHEVIHLEELRRNALFYQLLYIFANNTYQESVSNNNQTAIQFSKEYMDKYYDQDISRETLAKMVGISADYFSHLFKKEVGISPNEYLTKIRISQAKKNLITSNQRLKEIATSVGYSDEFYFSRIFKKVVGVSPTVYVKKNIKKIVPISFAFCSDMLALGVKPYATVAYKDGRPNPHISPDLSESICIDNFQLFRESAMIQPDLFILQDKFDVNFENIKDIAPVIQISWLEFDWRDHFRQIAKIIKKESEAENWLNNYKYKAQKASDHLKKIVKDETVLILRIYNGTLFIYGDRNIGAVIFQDLKLVPSYDLHKINICKDITPQELHLFDADHILLMVDDDEESKRMFSSLITSEQWKTLKGVQKNQLYFIEKSLWLEYSALSHDKIIDKALSIFSK